MTAVATLRAGWKYGAALAAWLLGLAAGGLGQALPDEDIVPARTPATRELREAAEKDSVKTIRTSGYAEGLEVGFVKAREEVPPGVMCFNVLKILNNSDQTFSFTPLYEAPELAKLIVQEQDQQEITLMPGQSRFIPVRMSFPAQTEGGQPYRLSARLSRSGGEDLGPPVSSEVSFQKQSKWMAVSPLKRMYTSAGDENYTYVPVTLSNTGNVRELFTAEIAAGSLLDIEGGADLHPWQFSLRPGRDTSLRIGVRCEAGSSMSSGADYRFDLRLRSEDGHQEEISVFFERIESSFVNQRSEEESPLIIDMRRLMSGAEAGNAVLGLSGNILLKNQRDISYRYETQNAFFTDRSKSAGDAYWRQARMLLQYKTPDRLLRVGDIGGGSGYTVGGRGIGYQHKGEKYQADALFVKSVQSPAWGYALQYQRTPSQQLRWRAGYAYSRNPEALTQVQAPSAGISFEPLPKQRISADFTFTRLSTYGRGVKPVDQRGLGYQLQYGGQVGEWGLTLKNSYASLGYVGSGNRGAMIVESEAGRKYGSQRSLRLSYTYARRNLDTRDEEGLQTAYGTSLSHRLNASYNFHLGKMPLALGSTLQRQRGEQFFTRTGESDAFGSSQARVSVASSWKSQKNSDISLTPLVQAGLTRVDQLPNGSIVNPNLYFFRAALDYRYKYGGISAEYAYQPVEGTREHAANPFAAYAKQIKLDATFDKEIWAEKLYLSLLASAAYDAEGVAVKAKQSIRYETESGWGANIDLSWQPVGSGSRDPSVSVGVRKVVETQQPRLKYYTLKVEFFKDANGNRIREPEEEGISQILVNLGPSKNPTLPPAEGQNNKYKPEGIMSDASGFVSFVKAPAGEYELTLEELFPPMDFTNVMGLRFDILLRQHTKFVIPYARSIIIAGKVEITRDKYSRLHGISPANIRVSVLDAQGNSFYALTDDRGNYLLSFPYTENFKVSMNNVLGEKFELVNAEQSFVSEGTQRFEVSFHFKEKGRSINFGGG
jgi:hypothetical protein